MASIRALKVMNILALLGPDIMAGALEGGPKTQMKTDSMINEITVSTLWAANRNRKWPRMLLSMWEKGWLNKDTNTIKYWIEEFKKGSTGGVIYANRRTFEVGDGNHRLVAAYLSDIQSLNVTFC